jgi:hypothetical protein
LLVVGNEAGNYKATQRNLSTWGPAAYVVEWKVGYLRAFFK